MKSMRYGIVILPEERWPMAAERWRRAEQLGFDHAWTFDHLTWRWLRESAWFPAVPTLTAAAAITSRIRIGTLVASPNVHHPVSFAKDVIALDDISGGRMICGIGAGAEGFDADVFGAPRLGPNGRADRFAEFVELTDLLLRQRETSYNGDHYRAVAAVNYPGCVQRPRVPFAIAASGARGMRLAARYAQAWVTVGLPGRFEPGSFDRMAGPVGDQLARLDDACLAQSRDPATLDRIVVAGLQIGGVLASPDSFAEASAMFAELGCTDLVVFWPRPGSPFAGDVGVLDRIAPLLPGAAEVAR